MFLKGGFGDKDMDNTSDKYVLPWLEAVKEISPRQVMIYTIDRETPDHDLQKATHEELDRIAALVREAGMAVSVSYWKTFKGDIFHRRSLLQLYL